MRCFFNKLSEISDSGDFNDCDYYHLTSIVRNIFPGPSGTQTAHQSGQRASGSVALANSFASSWPSLGSSGGRQSSSSSSKKSTFRFQPYKVKETWTHEFSVLADKDQVFMLFNFFRLFCMLKSSQIMQQNCLLKLIFIRMHDHGSCQCLMKRLTE